MLIISIMGVSCVPISVWICGTGTVTFIDNVEIGWPSTG